MKSSDAHLAVIDAACSLMRRPNGGARLREPEQLGQRGILRDFVTFVSYRFYVSDFIYVYI